jgi:cupin 2 domain-containing protein
MNLYEYETPKRSEIFDTLLDHPNIKIIRIVSSDRVDEKIYIQDEDEWVVVLDGSATLEIDGKREELKRGDSIYIASRVPHRVVETIEGTLWLAVHISMRP